MRFGLDVTQHQLTWDEIVVARAARRGRRVRRRLGVRPLQGAVRGSEGPVPRGVDAPGRARARDDDASAWVRSSPGMTHRNPSVLAAEVVTVDHLSGGRVECAVGARVERGRASRARDPVPAAARPDGPAGRGRAGDEAALHAGRRDVRGPAGAGGARHVSPAARAAAAPADLDRRHRAARARCRWSGRYADAWHGRADDADELRVEDGDHRRGRGGGRPRPVDDPSRVEPVDQRAVGRGEAELRVDGRRRDRLPGRRAGPARAAAASRSSSTR